jgi:hypothetical protein
MMSRIVIVILIYRRHKPIDVILEPSREVRSCSDTRNSIMFWKPKVLCRIHKGSSDDITHGIAALLDFIQRLVF